MTTESFSTKKFATVNGSSMAYIDEGQGDAIVFQHGNPTSSYLWRDIMRPLAEADMGRLVACDLIGMGDSDKIEGSDASTYTYAQQRDYLFALWDQLDLGDNITFVIHDWGSALGFDWIAQNSDRVKAVVYMEAIVTDLTWEQWPENARGVFQGFRSDAGESMILDKNLFVERVLPNSILADVPDAVMAEYRRPFAEAGEGRRPTLTWPRMIPIEGEPADVVATVRASGKFMEQSDLPKLFINADPGSILVGEQREYCRSWPNQTEVTVPGLHFIQEDSAETIATAIAEFLRRN